MKILAAIFAITFFFCTVRAQDCSCVKLKDEETTRQGFSELIVFKEKKAFQILRGTAVLGFEGEPLEDVFVEVFAYNSKEEKYKRVAGCRTSANGKFCFSNLAKGKYTMRFSKDGGFKITEVLVKVSPKSKRTDEITGVVEIGT